MQFKFYIPFFRLNFLLIFFLFILFSLFLFFCVLSSFLFTVSSTTGEFLSSFHLISVHEVRWSFCRDGSVIPVAATSWDRASWIPVGPSMLINGIARRPSRPWLLNQLEVRWLWPLHQSAVINDDIARPRIYTAYISKSVHPLIRNPSR